MNAKSHYRSVRLNIGNVILLSIVAFLMSGCPADKPTIDPAAKGQVTIKGSNTFGEELAPRLIAAYNKSRPNVGVALESKGSVSGIAALIAGECDIAAASRSATPDELNQARARGIELKEYVIGHYGVAVIVNPANPVGKLMPDQVRDIFSGAVQNWKAFGGPDVPIHICIRDPSSGTNVGFRELAMNNNPYRSDARVFTDYAQLAEAVSKDLGGIGYASMNMAHHGSVKAVSIDKYEPNALSVNEGWYPYARMLRLYTNQAKESPFARDFVLFVQRDPGQKILDEAGFVRRFEKRLNSLIPD